jgi:hypothetical protein
MSDFFSHGIKFAAAGGHSEKGHLIDVEAAVFIANALMNRGSHHFGKEKCTIGGNIDGIKNLTLYMDR